jgi:outer membrane protein OmpA-like peptidoglycan-associated protein
LKSTGGWAAALLVLLQPGTPDASQARSAAGADATARIDYLTFAEGAVPIALGGAAAGLGLGFEAALRAIDGSPVGFTLTSKPGAHDADAEFVYALPALTTFDRFAVPEVRETPSPTQTFTRTVEVHGSASGPDGGFVLLARGTLTTHAGRGEVTELAVAQKPPVSWIRLRLAGGVQPLAPQMFFEFSEIIGNGTRQTPAMVDHFRGIWQGRGVLIQLRQDGPLVTGCYDRTGRLTGTVTGNILHASGRTLDDQVASTFILSVGPDRVLRGVASSNRAPFRLYTGMPPPAGGKPSCAEPPPPRLGCGSVIHGIRFGYDSAVILPESAAVMTRLFDGLRSESSRPVTIEGHTSGEGSLDYNRQLSERRARAVVADLVARGIAASRLSAVGLGESRPIATNDDESGRSLNRRVEVKCQSPGN